MFLSLTQTPKIAPKDQKIASKGPKKVQNRPKMGPNLKQKVRAVPPKPKLIVYIDRSQKSFRTGPQPEKSLFNFQFRIFKFRIFKFWILKFQVIKFQIFKFWMLKIKIFKFLNFKFWNFKFSNFEISNFQILNSQFLKFWVPNFQILIFWILKFERGRGPKYRRNFLAYHYFFILTHYSRDMDILSFSVIFQTLFCRKQKNGDISAIWARNEKTKALCFVKL